MYFFVPNYQGDLKKREGVERVENSEKWNDLRREGDRSKRGMIFLVYFDSNGVNYWS